MSPLTIELIPDHEQGGFTAHVPDIPAYGEGETEDEAIADLKEALRAYVEAVGVEKAMSKVNAPLGLIKVFWDLQELTGAKAAAGHG